MLSNYSFRDNRILVFQKNSPAIKNYKKNLFNLFFNFEWFLFDIISVIGILTLLLLIFILYRIKINDHIHNDFQKIEIKFTKLLPKIKIIKNVMFNEIFLGRKQKVKIKIKI